MDRQCQKWHQSISPGLMSPDQQYILSFIIYNYRQIEVSGPAA